MCAAVGKDQKFIGVGHSMGGAALLIAALKHPQLFHGLVVYEPVVFPLELRVLNIITTAFGDSPLAKQCKRRRNSFASVDKAVENFSSKAPMSAFDGAVLRDYVQYGLTGRTDRRPAGDLPEPLPGGDSGDLQLNCSPAHEAAIYNTAHTHTTWSHLSRVSVPVRVVMGREAQGQVSALSRRIATAIGGPPRCELIEWNDASHFGPFEYPERLAECVEDFAEKLLVGVSPTSSEGAL